MKMKFLLSILLLIAALSSFSQEVSEQTMKEIFNEIKTPYKYGLVLTPQNDSFKVDCPTIFRKKSTLYMSYIVFDGKGYETWLAKSSNLLQWETMGRLLSFPKDSTAWNASQLRGYFSLYDTEWGGAYRLGKYKGRSWMSYIGGKSSGYEEGELSIGMAISDDMLHWRRFNTEPVVHHEAGITGDPYLQKIGDVWVMFYFGAFCKDRPKAFDRFACSYDLVHWTDWEGESLVEPSEDFDARYAHKPCVIKYKGVVYHFYNAVNEKDQRGIAVATSKDLGKSTLNFKITKK
jgi:predicted GH43/DUF377 family glycosyl hydrolase